MRLHPAVATALVLVGGVLLALPVFEWLRSTTHSASGISSSSFVSLASATLGLVFIAFGVLLSIDSRPKPGDPD